ncbi:MAG: TonB-dependent receptor [Myxococcaceae bacterium]|nr:TonB-dependent receptor [Myxococcaceae bacterium]
MRTPRSDAGTTAGHDVGPRRPGARVAGRPPQHVDAETPLAPPADGPNRAGPTVAGHLHPRADGADGTTPTAAGPRRADPTDAGRLSAGGDGAPDALSRAVPALEDDAHEHVDGGAHPPRPVAETTVRGQRLGRSASEVTLGRDVLRAAPRSGAVDLLRVVPGLVASQHSGEGKAHQLFLRGFDAVHGQDIELNVAGLPVNEVSHIHALGYADLNWLIPDVVREVRVTEGSYRAWQGDFAVAGTVRYELGLEEPGLTAGVSYGSFNRTRLFAGYRPADAPDTFAAAEFVRGDGFGPQRAFARGSVLAQLVLPLPALKVRAVLGSALGRFESPGVVREDAFAGGRADFFNAFGPFQGGASSRHQVLLGVELPGDGHRTTAEAFGVVSDLVLRNNFLGALRTASGDGLEQRHRDGLVGARLEHQRHLHVLGQTLRFDLGLGARRDGIEQRQQAYRDADGEVASPTIDARVVQTALTAWGEASMAPGPWRFMLGARVDALGFDVLDLAPTAQPRRGAFGARLGLKAGVERQLGPSLRLFGNYGDGFRSPQARQLADGETAPFVSVRGAELGAALDVERLSAKLALFGSSVADDVFFDHAVGSTVSLGPSLRGGASLVVTAKPLDGWLASGSATAATARVTTSGALLPYFAPLVGRLDTSLEQGLTIAGQHLRARLGAGVTAIGPRPLPFGDFSRPVALLDARASVRWRGVELVFDVQNLADARWRDGEFTFASSWEPGRATSLLPARHFTAGSPRTLFLTLEVHL